MSSWSPLWASLGFPSVVTGPPNSSTSITGYALCFCSASSEWSDLYAYRCSLLALSSCRSPVTARSWSERAALWGLAPLQASSSGGELLLTPVAAGCCGRGAAGVTDALVPALPESSLELILAYGLLPAAALMLSFLYGRLLAASRSLCFFSLTYLFQR